MLYKENLQNLYIIRKSDFFLLSKQVYVIKKSLQVFFLIT